MIDLALKFLVAELNSFLLARTGAEFGDAVLGRIVEDDGRWAAAENKITLALLNVEEERSMRGQLPEPLPPDGLLQLQPRLNINLHVVFAARFQNYEQGLRHLSLVLTFFQANPAFTQTEFPALNGLVGRLAADLMSPSYEQLNQIWAAIGGKYLPSAIYRIRLVALQDMQPIGSDQPITSVNFRAGRR
jgi:hypothetical protein